MGATEYDSYVIYLIRDEIVNQDTYCYKTTVSVAFRDYFILCPAQLWYSPWLGMWRHSKCMSKSVNFGALIVVLVLAILNGLIPLINLIYTVK